ncbi:MAG: hypothetical protein FJ082_13900 [Cyanobacteria bacterium K_Offshore_surface_m2_011]|nr:hypothetical protein [Cyanobacteria bacterium K_Offshore_surface_m2_011]
MLRIAHALNSQLVEALESAFPEAAGTPLDPQPGPASKPEFGDVQAHGALALACPLRLGCPDAGFQCPPSPLAGVPGPRAPGL